MVTFAQNTVSYLLVAKYVLLEGCSLSGEPSISAPSEFYNYMTVVVKLNLVNSVVLGAVEEIRTAHFCMCLGESWRLTMGTVSGPFPLPPQWCSPALLFSYNELSSFVPPHPLPWYFYLGANQTWTESLGPWLKLIISSFKLWMLDVVFQWQESWWICWPIM